MVLTFGVTTFCKYMSFSPPSCTLSVYYLFFFLPVFVIKKRRLHIQRDLFAHFTLLLKKKQWKYSWFLFVLLYLQSVSQSG